MPSHYLNQCWNIVNSTRCKFNRNSCIFIQENAFENVVCKIATTLSRSQCINIYLRNKVETYALPKVPIIHHSYVTIVLGHVKPQETRLLIQQPVRWKQTTKKTPKLSITGPLWGESGHYLVSLTTGQSQWWCGKHDANMQVNKLHKAYDDPNLFHIPWASGYIYVSVEIECLYCQCLVSNMTKIMWNISCTYALFSE